MGAKKEKTPEKALRSDARDNRAKLLAAATRLFARSGIDVGVDEVAREAGLGVGTFYRHFPTKEALLQATLVTQIEELRDLAQGALADPDVERSFFGFLEKLLVLSKRKKTLMVALESKGISTALPDPKVGEAFRDAYVAVLERAQREGVVREGITAAELMALTKGLHAALDATSEASRARVFEVLCDGLRPPTRKKVGT